MIILKFQLMRVKFLKNRFYKRKKKDEKSCYLIFSSQSGPSVGKSNEHTAPDQQARVLGLLSETPPHTLMASGACKIRLGNNVLQVLIQIIPLGVPKWGSHPLRGRSKLWLHVFWPSLETNVRSSAIDHCVALVRRETHPLSERLFVSTWMRKFIKK